MNSELLFRHQRNLHIEFVVDGFVAQTVKERTGAVAHVEFRTVDRHLASRVDRAVGFTDGSKKLHFFGGFFDRQIALDLVVAFRVLRDGFRDDKFGARKLGRTEEVVAFQVTYQFAGPFAFQIGASDAGHVDFKRTAGQFAIGHGQIAAFDFDGTGVFARHFVAGPHNGAGCHVGFVVGCACEGHHDRCQCKQEK
jgi:hypothetical protein